MRCIQRFVRRVIRSIRLLYCDLLVKVHVSTKYCSHFLQPSHSASLFSRIAYRVAYHMVVNCCEGYYQPALSEVSCIRELGSDAFQVHICIGWCIYTRTHIHAPTHMHFAHSHTCTHLSSAKCTDGDIKLVGGSSSNEGTLQVCVKNTWGTICDNNWSMQDATVACKQLGFSKYGTFI